MANTDSEEYLSYKHIPSSFSNPIYDLEMSRSIDPDKRDKFWLEEADKLHWFKKPTIGLDSSRAPLYQWYPDGEMNICYNCIDRHVEAGKGAKVAFHCYSAYTGLEETLTYSDLLEKVGKLATVLKTKFGV